MRKLIAVLLLLPSFSYAGNLRYGESSIEVSKYERDGKRFYSDTEKESDYNACKSTVTLQDYKIPSLTKEEKRVVILRIGELMSIKTMLLNDGSPEYVATIGEVDAEIADLKGSIK